MASILTQTINEADARLIRTIGTPTDAGFKLIRGWPWLAGAAASGATVHSLVVGLQSTTSYTDPKADGVTYSGTFVASENQAIDESERGDESRDCAIIQTLTLVKTVTTVASMGTPFKDMDEITLNYLGFKTGNQKHIYHKYTNLNTAQRTTAMGLTPTETGYTIVKREYKTEKDQTGTLYVVFELDTWPSSGQSTWASNKVQVGYQNYDARSNAIGHGLVEGHQLTGLQDTTYPSRVLKALRGDTSRVVTSLRITEKPNGEYQIDRDQKPLFRATADTSADVIRHEPNIGYEKKRKLARVWHRRTDTAMEQLTNNSGQARNNYTWPTDSRTYTHDAVEIDNVGDGSYTVSQELRDLTVATVTDVASLGTPFKTTDKNTLNYLGFRQGRKTQIAHRYINLAPATKDVAMALVPTESGYTIVGRKFVTEPDGTGTLFVVFEKDTWPDTGTATWASNKVQVGYGNHDLRSNTSGHGKEETWRLPGLLLSNYAAQVAIAQRGDTHRVVTQLRVIEKADGEFEIAKDQRITFPGSTDTAAQVVQISNSVGYETRKQLQRVWYRRDATAKAALIGVGGKARASYTWPTDSVAYSHDRTEVTDHGDGSYTVVQRLRDLSHSDTLGTPYKSADRETLNYLGFQEGRLEHVYHRYINKDPARRAYFMSQTPTETGYTLVKRKFDVEADGNATFYCIFEKDRWPDTGASVVWSTGKKLVGQANADAGQTDSYRFGKSVQYALTGVSKGGLDSAFTAAKTGEAGYIAAEVVRVEKANGEYEVRSTQRPVYVATDTTHSQLVSVKNTFADHSDKQVARVWYRRSKTAMGTLTTGSGKAVSDFNYGATTYTHHSHRVESHGDGTYDVIQVGFVPRSTGGTSWPEDTDTQKTVIRKLKYRRVRKNADGTMVSQYKRYVYTNYERFFATRASADAWVSDTKRYGPGTGIRFLSEGKWYAKKVCDTWGIWTNLTGEDP